MRGCEHCGIVQMSISISGMVCLVCGALKNQRAKQIRVGSGTHVETAHDGVQLHHETAGEQS